MKEIRQEYLAGERLFFKGENLKIFDTIFTDGESSLVCWQEVLVQ